MSAVAIASPGEGRSPLRCASCGAWSKPGARVRATARGPLCPNCRSDLVSALLRFKRPHERRATSVFRSHVGRVGLVLLVLAFLAGTLVGS